MKTKGAVLEINLICDTGNLHNKKHRGEGSLLFLALYIYGNQGMRTRWMISPCSNDLWTLAKGGAFGCDVIDG